MFDFAWTFDTGLDGWAAAYSEPASLHTDTLVSFDATTGAPDAGSAKYEIPFTTGSQKFETAVYPASPLDLTGKTLSANVVLDSGLGGDPTQTGYVKLYVKSGDAYAYADSGGHLLPAGGGWINVTLDGTMPEGYVADGYNPADIREIGLEFGTGSGTNFVTAVIHLDTVGYY